MSTSKPSAEHAVSTPDRSPSLAFEAGPDEVLDRLVVRVAGSVDRDAIDGLAARAELPRPEGALLVGTLEDRPLAAVSLTTGDALREPTPAGAAAVAAVRYELARLRRRRRVSGGAPPRSRLRSAA